MIDTAVLLAAGEGSRLRSAAPFKPLCRVAGHSLLEHAVFGLEEAGLKRVIVVLGYGADQIEAFIRARDWPIAVETARAKDHRRPNGTSVLDAERFVAKDEALLAMCDHLVVPELYRCVAAAGASGGARLAVDRHLESEWVDLEDVTRVQTVDGRIAAIGKGLAQYDCFDTGVFAIGPQLFEALKTLDSPSLTEGMRILAVEGSAHTIDCTDLPWIDVDDATALEKAERWATVTQSIARPWQPPSRFCA